MTGFWRWQLGQRMLGILYPARCPLCDGLLRPEKAVYNSRQLPMDNQKAAGKGSCLAGGSAEAVPGGLYGVHERCARQLNLVREPVCMRCGRPLAAESQEYCGDCKRLVQGRNRGLLAEDEFDQGKSLFLYQGPVKKMMYRFKYQNRREYGAFFGMTAVKRYGEWLRRTGVEIIVPVPMYGPKKRRRGYNQAAVFAKELSRWTGIPWDGHYVSRVKNTRPMKELNDLERKNNLKNAFQIAEKGVKYKKVLLVDDIYTTGSTAGAVARVLKESGARDVYFMSISIGKGR